MAELEQLKYDEIREWQLHPVTVALKKDLELRKSELALIRPFTPGDPYTTYSDTARIEAIIETIDGILPLFTSKVEEVEEQLSEHK